ncbi:nucleotide exchange factor GrpE [Natronocalculus amylovorans]|uniref:Protein GrpE n=1 Tax=Natronocalculus amylovorans TaxID=2917812 RepID=A0AAE3KAP2_9EURY|nr:nucleotide exchange factor GrpE [Natronocalculus amylovorans]MCL9816959.1 nucleotide exchange factor GrpE [Natronocalculus amylovorans]NUE02979.1 nucleotide exchange factor GrpE [Halorubraceae archaeon YAN]
MSDDSAEPATEESADESAAVENEQIDEELVERVAAYDSELAATVERLTERVEEAENAAATKDERINELESKLRRAQADFKNYKQRTKRKQEEMKARATEDLVERTTKVRDNLVRALDQDADADIRPGVRSTLEEFDRILDEENVTVINPDIGSDVDPKRHQVMMRVESDQPAGTIVDVYQPGYEMAEKVIKTAQVTVSDQDN